VSADEHIDHVDLDPHALLPHQRKRVDLDALDAAAKAMLASEPDDPTLDDLALKACDALMKRLDFAEAQTIATLCLTALPKLVSDRRAAQKTEGQLLARVRELEAAIADVLDRADGNAPDDPPSLAPLHEVMP
jgi:hypothetical protein